MSFKINTKNVYDITRSPTAKVLSKTGKSAIDRLLKLKIYGLSEEDVEKESLALQKSRRVREEAWSKVIAKHKEFANGVNDEEENLITDSVKIGDSEIFGMLEGRSHYIDKETGSIHLINCPYTIMNYDLEGTVFEDSSSYNSIYYNALGLLLCHELSGSRINKCYIHHVFVDTPEDLIDKYDSPLIHKLPEGIDPVVTIEVELPKKERDVIINSIMKVKDYLSTLNIK